MVTVCFSTTDSLLSRLVRWFTKSPVSHALLVYRDETLGQLMVLEATGRGFVAVPWTRWLSANTLVASFNLPTSLATQRTALSLIAQDLGTEYDSLGLVGFIWRRWVSRYHNPLASTKKLVCAEVVAMFLVYSGVLSVKDDTESFTPDDLYKIVKDFTRV